MRAMILLLAMLCLNVSLGASPLALIGIDVVRRELSTQAIFSFANGQSVVPRQRVLSSGLELEFPKMLLGGYDFLKAKKRLLSSGLVDDVSVSRHNDGVIVLLHFKPGEVVLRQNSVDNSFLTRGVSGKLILEFYAARKLKSLERRLSGPLLSI